MSENINEMRAGVKTNPSHLATAILNALEKGEDVKLLAMGDAIRVASIALAYVNLYNANNIPISVEPSIEETIGDKEKAKGIPSPINVFYFLIRNLDHTIITPEENSRYLVVKVINHYTLLKSALDEYSRKGYRLVSTCPITIDGRTSHINVIFEKEEEI